MPIDKTDELVDTLRDIGTPSDQPKTEVALAQREVQPAPQPADRRWTDATPAEVATMLERRGANRTKLLDWVRANLNEGHDFGVIKGRKSLWKAGAEKIAGMLGLQVNWPDLDAEMDRLRCGHATTIFLACNLLRDGKVQAQGAGARNIDDDNGDWNKALKMCKKSAMIDAVLNVAGLSEVFTQDLDDDTYDTATLSDEAVDIMKEYAMSYFGDRWEDVLESLARRRFNFDDGNYRRIPAFRFHDALRSLRDKAEGQISDETRTQPEG